jgi:hypothetical protein
LPHSNRVSQQLYRSDPPFGGFLAVPVGQLKRIYVSPGPLYDPEGRKDDYLRGAVVFVPEIPEGSKKIEDRRKWQ